MILYTGYSGLTSKTGYLPGSYLILTEYNYLSYRGEVVMTKFEARIAFLLDCAKEDMYTAELEGGIDCVEFNIAEGQVTAYQMALNIICEELYGENSDS